MAKLDTIYHHLTYDLCTNLWMLPNSGQPPKCYSRRMDLNDRFFADHREKILSFLDPENPVILQVKDHVLYGLVRSEEADYVVGPVRCMDNYDLRCTLPELQMDSELLQRLAGCTLETFASRLLLLYDVFCEKEMSLQECLMANSMGQNEALILRTELSRRTYVNREHDAKHNPYDHEMREMYAIESGNMTQLRNTWTEVFTGTYGVTSKDPVRNGRNLAMIVVALATRAAIRGGVLPEVAMSLGDVYIQRIEELPNIMEVGTLTQAAERELTELVVAAKNRISEGRMPGENPLIVRCKDYVYKHLHSKLTVQEIAEHLGIHPNYLSSTFKKNTGVSLYQYILDEKISLVKNLLTYSDYSLGDISCTLGFTSQSHLGSLFKHSTGMTLLEYRKRYRKTEV